MMGNAAGAGMLAGMMALFGAFIILFWILALGMYIYTGFAFMTIGKKAKLKNPALAWIPLVGPLIIAYQCSKMHWWPWFLIIGIFIPVIGFIFSIAFAVFSIIWQWKMFEKIKYPGWWAILCLIPFVNLVLYGIAAWSKK